ncbi:MAG TPA: glycerophosphodiester phosphodiesterase family protein [Puia sp.]|uniref:glycerophosphodiester phosphodiesterase family protein n=1 Tax=Puia sp. TaxID=2045100 RepID=UPI002D0C951C|nr:glycerophosphodiester phosphodiesterase family protein [Puia sp.]HVU99086.1 glycerophosphodiester phosphodiesterase family protein [Puia sp.]
MLTGSFYRLLAIAACIFQIDSASAQQLAPLPARKHPFIVVAHRGDHTQAPENTLQAYTNAIAAGADYVEIDLRTTADSQLVILHDASVDRMTNGKGLVKDMRLDSLRLLKVKDRMHPEWGESAIPTFREVLQLCRNRIYIYLDFKNADPATAWQAIVREGMEKQVVVYINAPQQFTRWREVAPAMPLMVSLPGSIRDTAALKDFLDKYHPEILDGGYEQYTPEMVSLATKMGYTVLPDIQGAGEGPEKWGKAIQKGIRALQTDRPGQLITWLKEKNLRR